MNEPVTLAHVAKAAGVAVGTASRVLNNFTDVSPDPRHRVLEAVARLRYQPLRKRQNVANRSRAVHRTHNIGLVYLGMDDTLLHVPVLTEVLHGIETAVTQVNGNLLFANLPHADHVPAFLRENKVEGLIVKTSQYGALPDPENNALIRNILRFPLVWAWAKPEGAPGDLCSFNHESAARQVAAHLRERGHGRVAFLNPKKGKSSLEHIKKEFVFACAQRQIELTLLESGSARVSTWPEPALTSHEELLPLVDEWRAMPERKRPTALFLPADNIVMHLYVALEKRGLLVGRDVSVISCNNEKSLARALKPSLATIDVHAQRVGSRAVEQLLWRLRAPMDESVQTVLLESTLVEGDSVMRI